MENPITRAEHEEFRRRLEEENKRRTHAWHFGRTVCVRSQRWHQRGKAGREYAKYAERAEKQGKRLEALEGRDGEKWRKVMGYIATAIVGIVLGYLFKRIGM